MKSGFSNTNSIIEENQFTKENQGTENPFIGLKMDKSNSIGPNPNSNPDDVLTTVTNSIKTNGPNALNFEYKKSNSVNLGSTSGLSFGGATPNNSNLAGGNSMSAKKENEKKIWRKRI